MARELNPERQVLEVQDRTTGEVYEIYYRMPTNEERVRYGNKTIYRKGKKVLFRNNLLPLNIEFGKLLITGFGENVFTLNGKPISSEKSSPNFFEGWRDLVAKNAPEYLSLVGQTAMNAVAISGKDDLDGLEEIEELLDVKEGEGSPLSVSSDGASSGAPTPTGGSA